jgi:hypothetical protein
VLCRIRFATFEAAEWTSLQSVTNRNLFVVAAAHVATMAGALDMEAATFVITVGRMSVWYVCEGSEPPF